ISAILILVTLPPPRSPLFPYTTLFRSNGASPDATRTSPRTHPRDAGSAPRHPRLEHALPYLISCARANRVKEIMWASLSSFPPRSEEHTSELQSLAILVCRLLLEKKNK